MVFILLSSCGDYESKKLLGNYISNFLYSDILSDNYVNVELLLILYRTLEFEVNQLVHNDNIPAIFLDSGINIFLLRRIIQRSKVQKCLGPIFKKILTEINSIPFEMNCELQKLIDVDVTENDVRDLQFESDKVKGEYIQTLDFDMLQNEKEKQNDDEMKSYLDIHIKECEEYKDKNLFSGDTFFEKMYHIPEGNVISATVLDRYSYHISQIAAIVMKIIQILKDNYELIPLPIRQICKMISIIIRNKFKDIPTVRVNAFISRFFIDILFDEFLSMPNRYKLIQKHNLSPSIEPNKNIVFKVLHYLFMGYFFDIKMDQNFAVFNWVFIEIMPEVLSLFDKLIDVNLPPNQNSRQGVTVTMVAYSMDVVLGVYDVLSKNKEKVQKNLSDTDSIKTFTFIKVIENNMEKIKKITKKDKEEKKLSFYYTYSIEYGDKLNKPKQIIDVELPDTLTKKMFELCYKLNEYHIDISQCENNSTLGIINFLIKASAIGIIPMSEYTNLITIKSLLKKSNFNVNSFYENIIQQMKSKIDAITYENIKKDIAVLEYNKASLDEEISFYNQLQIEQDILPLADRVIIEMKLNNKQYFYDYDKQFEEVIAKKWYDHVEFHIGDFSSKSIRDYYYNAGYYSLNQFIALFPDIVASEKEKVFEFIKANRINLFVDNFIKALNEGITRLNFNKGEDYTSTIKSFFFSKIYNKIYPFKPLPKDIALHKNTVNNSWITLNVLIGKEVDVDVLIPVAKEKIKAISQRKSYYDKVDEVLKLFEIIKQFLNKNGLKNENINVYLLYLINKAKPYRLYSDVEYMSKFNVDNNKETKLNIQMMTYCVNLLLNLNEEDLKIFLTPQ